MADRYAGIDWASDKHDVLVADQDGEELLVGTFVHDEKGLTALCRVLVRLEVVLVAIERPDGLLVERLLDAGLQVLALHPNKVAAARDREAPCVWWLGRLASCERIARTPARRSARTKAGCPTQAISADDRSAHDMRMLNRRREPTFVLETSRSTRVARQTQRDHLDRHPAAQLRVPRGEHLTHPTSAQPPLQHKATQRSRGLTH